MRKFSLFLYTGSSSKLPLHNALLLLWRKQLFETICFYFADLLMILWKSFQFCIIWWNFTKDKCCSKVGNWIFMFYLLVDLISFGKQSKSLEILLLFCTVIVKSRKLTPSFWETYVYFHLVNESCLVFINLVWRKQLFESFLQHKSRWQ